MAVFLRNLNTGHKKTKIIDLTNYIGVRSRCKKIMRDICLFKKFERRTWNKAKIIDVTNYIGIRSRCKNEK